MFEHIFKKTDAFSALRNTRRRGAYQRWELVQRHRIDGFFTRSIG